MEFLTLDSKKSMGSVSIGFLPSRIPGLKLWCRYNQGITITGDGVSQWDDQSGNGNHLKQTDNNRRPEKKTDGSILFSGLFDALVADAFTLVQPENIYILAKQITWTGNDRWYDGNAIDTGTLDQASVTPELKLYAGTFTNTISLPLGVYGVVTAVINSTNTVLQLNNDAPVIGNAGTSNMGGFTLGARPDYTSLANIQVMEVIIHDTIAHDAATRAQVINYLARVGGLSI